MEVAAGKCRQELIAALDRALAVLRGSHALSDEGVHDARKAIKKARAILRLMRAGLGDAAYRRENTALRDVGRILAPIRDARALEDAFIALRRRHPSELAELAGIERALESKRLSTLHHLLGEPEKVRDCIRSLAGSRARLAQRKRIDSRAASIREGMRRIHRAGRKALVESKRDATPQALHEWRKQVKYLMNALQAIDAPVAAAAGKMGKRADGLADCLGEYHDLVELERYLAGDAGREMNAKLRREIANLVGNRREKLRKRAFALGERIYRRKFRDW